MKNVLILFIALCFAISGCAKKGGTAPTAGSQTQQKADAEKTTPTETPTPSGKPITEERTLFDFEETTDGWEVPAWALDKTDYAAKEAAVSGDFRSKGGKSLKMTTDFPGDIWSAALVEVEQYLDLSPYRVIRADVYLPKEAPLGLKSKIIVTVGENWKFVEMSQSLPLLAGEWTTISASIEPGSYDWKRVVPDAAFAKDVRKIAVRVECNKKPKYSGPIYVDNIRVGR